MKSIPSSQFEALSADELSSVEGGALHIGFKIPFTNLRFDLYIDDRFDVCLSEKVGPGTYVGSCAGVPIK
jgi:hypothetical protein